MQELKASLINSWTKKDEKEKHAESIYKEKCMYKIEHNKNLHKHLFDYLHNGPTKFGIGYFKFCLDNKSGIKFCSELDDDIINSIPTKDQNLYVMTRCEIFANALEEKMGDIGIRFRCESITKKNNKYDADYNGIKVGKIVAHRVL